MAKSSSVQAVIFDYGQVLSLPPRADLFTAMAGICGVSEEQFQHYYWTHRDAYDRGDLDRESYWRPLMAADGEAEIAERIEQVVRLDVENWTRLDGRMLAWLTALQTGGWKTAVLSNMPDPLLQPMRQQFDWLASLTHQTFSCEVGAVKPDAAIYHHCLQGLGVTAAEALFLDDREVNVEGARRLGMQALQFHSLERLAEDLQTHGYELPSPMETVAAGS